MAIYLKCGNWEHQLCMTPKPSADDKCAQWIGPIYIVAAVALAVFAILIAKGVVTYTPTLTQECIGLGIGSLAIFTLGLTGLLFDRGCLVKRDPSKEDIKV